MSKRALLAWTGLIVVAALVTIGFSRESVSDEAHVVIPNQDLETDENVPRSQLDDSQARAALDRARAEREAAEADLERVEREIEEMEAFVDAIEARGEDPVDYADETMDRFRPVLQNYMDAEARLGFATRAEADARQELADARQELADAQNAVAIEGTPE